MKIIRLSDKSVWDKCRSCGKLWDIVQHYSYGRCEECCKNDILPRLDIVPLQDGVSNIEHLEKSLRNLILFDETLQQFGYEVRFLSRGSSKCIIHKCPECLQSKKTPFKVFIQGKNLRHNYCKGKQISRTNLDRYGVINTCNKVEQLQKRLEEKDREIIRFFESENYIVTKIEHISHDIIIYFICPLKQHRHHITWRAWNIGKQRCGKCHGTNNRITIEVVKQAFKEESYTLHTTEYENNNTELFYTCDKGHNDSTSWKIWERGHRCPICNPHSTSRGEEEIREIFQQFNPIKTRDIIAPYEIDVYFPDHKIAIEYCGLFWHSEKQDRIESSYHYKKMKNCNKQNIRLITIFEDEWQQQKEICISRIRNVLGIIDRKIYARKCEVNDVSREISNGFFNNNHLQQFSKNTIHTFGLYYNEQLVYAASIGSPSRRHTSKGQKVLEIKRMAPTLNTIVVGGASRLFKCICEYARANKYDQVKSYCDMRWGTGKVYEKLGMELIGETHYTPHVTNGKIRQRIQTFAGKQIPKGWYKIYDCGHQTWCLNI